MGARRRGQHLDATADLLSGRLPVHHVELLLDAAADGRVQAEWDRLADAGLPSLRHHRSPSNRPHVTLTMVDDWPPDGLASPLTALPLPVRLGPLAVFGAGPWVLVRTVVLTDALLRLHRDLVGRLGAPASAFCAVGRWVPHVTLARRLEANQLARAVSLLGPTPDVDVLLDRVRHWDSVARVAEPLR